MPTGYTHKIKDGITFEEYAMGCARAFGALYQLRDTPSAPIPESIEPNSYHLNALKETLTEKEEFLDLNEEELQEQFDLHVKESIDFFHRVRRKQRELREKYEEKLDEIDIWNPPEILEPLKKFMREQVESSIDFDCNIYSYDDIPPNPKRVEWIDETMKQFERDIKYHSDHKEKELTKSKENNEWIKTLRESIESFKEDKEMDGMDDDQLSRLGCVIKETRDDFTDEVEEEEEVEIEEIEDSDGIFFPY